MLKVSFDWVWAFKITGYLSSASNLNIDSKQKPRSPALVKVERQPWSVWLRVRWLGVTTIVLVACFGGPLWHLCRYAWGSELFSYILLVPLISIYFAWSKRQCLGLDSAPVRGLAGFPLLVGAGVLAGVWWATNNAWNPPQEDYLAGMVFAFLSLFVGACFFFLGTQMLRQLSFSLVLLLFMIPFPTVLQDSLTHFLQHRSADVAQLLFALSGMPLLRRDTLFLLPGFPLEVAPECSGIHSTIVLFITSLVAGYVCLRSPWRRGLLTLAVIPLALLRNGLRVFTIGQLCVNVSPDMINSYIHKKGGPIFFALSLIPFFLILLLLWRSERKAPPPMSDSGLRPQPMSP
jgi:exosortase C (VPDSG-CTERM-specific)